MLNTQSRLTSVIIWLTIAGISLTSFWSVLALSPPLDMAQAFQASEAAAAISRNQVLFAGLVGFAGLSLAYLFNGWRDRAERRHTLERAEKRLASVMQREAEALSEALFAVASQPVAGGARARLADLTDAGDSLLLGLPVAELARLGPGAAGAVQSLRRKARSITNLAVARDEAAGRPLSPHVIEAAVAARDAAQLLGLLSIHGPAASDRLRLVGPTETEIAELASRLADSSGQPRLLPAA